MSARSNYTGTTRQKRGFTLIEIVVVITLVGIITGVVGLRFTGSPSSHESARILIQTHLEYARNLALRTHRIVGITFDPQQKTYTGVSTLPSDDSRNPFAGNPLHVEVHIDSLTTDLPNHTIYFDSFGRPVNAGGTPLSGNQHITLTARGIQHTIVIEAQTGYVHR
jgi:prepilin-type N-terminal cleavage/methylation domain-containing protein